MQRLPRNAPIQQKLLPFPNRRKVLATVFPSFGQDGTVFVQGGGSYKNDAPAYPFASLSMAAEHYNRLHRLVTKKKDVGRNRSTNHFRG